MRSVKESVFIGVILAVLAAFPAAAADGPLIRTSPLGLVRGDLEVEVDLGGAGVGTLYLDGVEACKPTGISPKCVVDLGPELHVHLLELITTAFDGSIRRAERWVNRPGHEANLEIELASRPIGNVCGGRLSWYDIHNQQPVVLEVEAAGEHIVVLAENRIFGYPCASVGETEIVAASAVFPDGRRASAVALTGDTGRSAGIGPQPVVLENSSLSGGPCPPAPEVAGGSGERTDGEGFEIAFVLDPTVDYAALASLGDRAAENPAGGDSVSAWERASSVLVDADRMWYLRPDSSLLRLDGYANSRENWLGSFFQIGSSPLKTNLRLADAVATAGLAAGALPHRRAVVLILGSGPTQDKSRFSSREVMSYLAEVGVPLVVIRTQGKNDDWPAGVEVHSLAEFAESIEGVRGRIDDQCVEWFPAHWEPHQIRMALSGDLSVAGRRDAGPEAGLEVWRRAALTETATEGQPVSDEPVARGKVEVTAVEVLVRALDERGNSVDDLTAGDLRVAEDGQSVPVLQLEPILPLGQAPDQESGAVDVVRPAPQPARKIVPVSVYVERRLAGSSDILPSVDALIEQTDWLTSLGPVDIVVAEGSVETVLEGATDPDVVRSALKDLGKRRAHGHAVERIRTNYVRTVLDYPDRGGAAREGESEPSGIISSSPNNELRIRTMTAARASIFEEDALLRSTMERMNDWALGLQTSGPRLLFLVGTGFDEDPIDFYVRFIEFEDPSLGTAARAEFVRYNQATRVERVGRELAAAGWMVVPVATRIAGSPRSSAEFSGRDTFQAFMTDRTDGPYLSDVEFMLLDPLGSQQHLAEPSGGEVVVGGRGLKKLVAQSSGWYRLSYQVARPPDGALHEVTVTSERQDVKVENTGVVVSGTSEGRAAMRLRRLMDDPTGTGELPVRLLVGPAEKTEDNQFKAPLTISVDLESIAPLFTAEGVRALRFSVAVRSGQGAPFVHHSVATAAGALDGMQFDAPIQWSGRDAELAVVVEDLGSGAWGGAVSKLED